MATAKMFTVDEVAKHNLEADCYTIVEGKVYDITKYLRLHPGGMKLLFKNAGADSTGDFLALRHSFKARAILEQYYVGDLAGAQQSKLSVHAPTSASAPSPFAQPRPVGKLVGPQPFLTASPPMSGPSLSSVRTAHNIYPPPRSAVPGHPDRMAAYKEQALRTLALANANSSGQGSSGGFSITLSPPEQRIPSQTASASPPAPVLSSTTSATPSTHTMHLPSKTLASPESRPEPEEDEEMLDSLRHEPHSRHDHDAPPFAHSQAHAAPFTISHASSVAPTTHALSSLSISSAAAAASSPTPASSVSSPLAARTFTLRAREQCSANVQFLSFEPLAESLSIITPSPSAASTTLLTPNQTNAAAAIDPANWLRIPLGGHISIGTTLTDGSYIKRPYTPILNAQGKIDLVVKVYDQGVLTPYLHTLPVGSKVDVFGPFNEFDFEMSLKKYSRWICIAQGTGVAPFYPLIQHITNLAAKEKAEKRLLTGNTLGGAVARTNEEGETDEAGGASNLPELFLLDCSRTENEILLAKELAELAANVANPRVFRMLHLISRPTTSNLPAGARFGRLTASLLFSLMREFHLLDGNSNRVTPSTLFLVCGSDAFKSDVSSYIHQTVHVPADRIFCF